MASISRVRVLVDWDTTRRLVAPKHNDFRDIENVFERLQNGISQYLVRRDSDSYFRVDWRIYHGWHQGKTKTADRLLFEKYARQATSKTIKRTSFSTNYEYSESMCCNTPRSPIYDTLRSDRQTGEPKQKMVDTILVCDLLQLARTKSASLLIVVASDDDFVPALFAAEAWSASVVWLHTREQLSQALDLKGLAERFQWR